MRATQSLLLLLSVLCASVPLLRAQPDEDFDPYEGGGGGGYGAEDDPYGGGGYGGYGGPGGGGGKKSEAVELKTSAEIKSFLSEEIGTPSVVGYFDVTTNEADMEVFLQASSSHGSSYRFAYSTEKEVLEESKYDGCAVIVHKPSQFVSDKHEKVKSRYPSKTLKLGSLEKFVFDKALPLVGEKTFKSADSYDNTKLPMVTVFADVNHEKNAKGYQYLANRVRKVAKEFAGKLVFNIASKSDFSYILADYGIGDLSGKQDVGVGLVSGDMHYKMTDKFSVESLKAFVEAWKAGSLEGKKKAPPSASSSHEDEDEGEDGESAVVTLTNSNFADVVTKSSADVLVEFYAPWCGHCKALKPEFSRAAKAFADDEGITLAALDATAHEVPKEYDVQGYPTLYFVPADTKKPESYDGGRDEESIVEFLKSKRTTTKK